MKKYRKLGCPLLCLLLAGLSAFLYMKLEAASADRYTVCMYYEEWHEEYSDYVTRRIEPMEEAQWAAGSHDAESVAVRFDGAVLRQSAGYGPTGLNGSFAAADVNALYCQEVLTEDWPFGWGIYFTNDWCVCDAYLHVMLPQEPDGEVVATLTIYRRGEAAPDEILTWTGYLGERIGFGAIEL